MREADIRDARVGLKMLVDRFAEKISKQFTEPHKLTAYVYDDLESVEAAIRNDELDMVCISSLDFIAARNELEVVPVVVASSQPDVESRFLLLARKDVDVTGLSDLKGKKIIVENSINGTIGLVWLNAMLLKDSLPEARDLFTEVKTVDRVSQVVLPVFFEKADFCVVTRYAFETMKELNPQIGNQLAALYESDGYITQVLCLDPDFQEDKRDLYYIASQELLKDPDGYQMMVLFHSNHLFRYEPRHLEGIERLYNEYTQLTNKKYILLDDLTGNER